MTSIFHLCFHESSYYWFTSRLQNPISHNPWTILAGDPLPKWMITTQGGNDTPMTHPCLKPMICTMPDGTESLGLKTSTGRNIHRKLATRNDWEVRKRIIFSCVYILHKLLADWSYFFAECGTEHHDLLLMWSQSKYVLDITSHI